MTLDGRPRAPSDAAIITDNSKTLPLAGVGKAVLILEITENTVDVLFWNPLSLIMATLAVPAKP